jgi:DNA-binding transcriptional LysR family regulator
VIRVDPAQEESLVGRPFLHDRLVVVAAPDLPSMPGKRVPALVRGSDAARSWTAVMPSGPREIEIEPALRLSSLVMIRDAVRAGAGVARLPLSLVLGDIHTGRLVNWGDVAGSEIALWALYPSRRLLNARVSAFLDHLRRAFPRAAPEELAAYLDA